ncbi:Scytalone dehydratase [Xylariales sp. PMI_506]|nr:Scytalone dehydratase [Xylariales sp. PMI_506]
MSFEIYIPENLEFKDYIAVVQTARIWADGYDRKRYDMLRAALAPNVAVDYSLIVPAWGVKHYTGDEFATLWLSEEHLGLKPLASQHFLGQPYFKSVSAEEIVVEWQQIAAHGRREGEARDAVSNKIVETSDGHSHMQHRFIKVEGRWKIAGITPSLIYQTGDFMHIRRAEGTD